MTDSSIRIVIRECGERAYYAFHSHGPDVPKYSDLPEEEQRSWQRAGTIAVQLLGDALREAEAPVVLVYGL